MNCKKVNELEKSDEYNHKSSMGYNRKLCNLFLSSVNVSEFSSKYIFKYIKKNVGADYFLKWFSHI